MYMLLPILCLLCQWVCAIDPLREYTMTPGDLGISYREVRVRAEEADLNVWVMEAPPATSKQVTVVIAGSDAGNMGFSLPYAKQLLNAGYDVITFDYRGFGASTDFEHQPDYLYHREYIEDFVAVLQFSKGHFTSNRTAVLAFSMGTLIASAGYQHAAYDALIAEAFVFSPQRNVRRIHELSGKKLVLPKGYAEDANAVQSIDIPMLLFSARADKVTTGQDAKIVVEMRANRHLVSYEGEHLRGAASLGFPIYFGRIAAFIDSI